MAGDAAGLQSTLPVQLLDMISQQTRLDRPRRRHSRLIQKAQHRIEIARRRPTASPARARPRPSDRPGGITNRLVEVAHGPDAVASVMITGIDDSFGVCSSERNRQ